MLTRLAQIALAVAGMALILRYGLVRSPGIGEVSNLHPVQWNVHAVPLGGGIICLAVAFGLILFVKEQ